MAKILTKLRIDEVSAVDAGAGDGTKIILMKRDDDRPRSKPHVERHARRLRKFQEIFCKQRDDQEISPLTGAADARSRSDVTDDDDRDDEEDDLMNIDKAHRNRGGSHGLTGALLEHLHDRLEHRREQHGYQKSAKESPMSSLQEIAKSHGVPGVVEIAKNITEEQRSFRITEEEFVKLIDTAARVAHPELGARAFEKVYERNPLLAKAIAVIKAGQAEQLLSGGSASQASERGSAYGDLMVKADEYRNAHPECSISQAFEKVFTAPANRELAKRERVESAPR